MKKLIIPLILISVVLISGCVEGQTSHFSDTQNNMGIDDTINLGMWGIKKDVCNNIDAKFSYSPIPVEDIKDIGPMGALTEVIAGHIIPNDHSGIGYEGTVDIIMPVDGYLVNAERHPFTPEPGGKELQHYHLYFEASCSLYFGLLHVTSLEPEIVEQAEALKKVYDGEGLEMEHAFVRIPIKAGQKIGTAEYWKMLGVIAVDTRVPNTKLANPESYSTGEVGQPWRLYGVSFFDYYEEPLRSELYSKSPRTAEPLGGTASYDIPGKLIGGWFMEGTNGMEGIQPESPTCGNMVCSYWYGHFAIVPDHINPDEYRLQFGYKLRDYMEGPYAIKGNGPDPAEIGVEDGLVKYELLELEHAPGGSYFIIADETVVGTVLIEMVDDMTAKIEPFVGKTKDEIAGFTDNVKVYVR